MKKDRAMAFLQASGFFAIVTGLMMLCYFSDRVPVIIAWMDNDMFTITGFGSAFLCVLCLIYPAFYGLHLVINKLVGVPVTNDQWEKDLIKGMANWSNDIKKDNK